ncbi:CRISPR locus-related DNA-binding protein [Candidatus Woesearchaeota archaeon]|nr:CRISPR locus-related DNA-binding protein [Candidatus Woesearchaeota archaeon]
MANVLIATLYGHEPVIVTATKVSADRLILLPSDSSDDTQREALNIIQKSLGSVMNVKVLQTKTYDVVSVASEIVKIIDMINERDNIFVDVTSGRKTRAFGVLFGCYARASRVKKILYVRKEDNKIVQLPKVSYNLPDKQRRVVAYLSYNPKPNIVDLLKRMKISRAMLYRYISDLKDMEIIEENKGEYQLTDYGKIVVL